MNELLNELETVVEIWNKLKPLDDGARRRVMNTVANFWRADIGQEPVLESTTVYCGVKENE